MEKTTLFQKHGTEKNKIALLLLIFSALLFFYPAYAYAEKNPIEGVWVNSYGSIMKVEMNGNKLTGCYSSQTTSPGSFYMAGFTEANLNKKSNSATVAFTVRWRAYNKIQTDGSLHWTSAMSGMYSIKKIAATSIESIEVINAINAPAPGEGVNSEAGLFPGALIYTRYADQDWECPAKSSAGKKTIKGKLIGAWKGKDTSLVIEKDDGEGFVTGHYTDYRVKFPVVGYYDYDPEQKPAVPEGVTSVSLVASNLDSRGGNHGSQLAFSGNLIKGKLELFVSKTFALVGYMSSKLVGQKTFEKETR